ncbi:hypothetical protein E4K68_03765 [Desulfosporosinus sp. Sb-LF]|nr:hypothetical protein E4K68_03765 [Desulfosporosinus sp. Sb-LF]
MLTGLVVPKSGFYRILWITLIASLLLSGLGACTQGGWMSSKDDAKLSLSAVPLLLNSGSILAKDAEVSITLWFENGNVPLEILTQRPMPGWKWVYKELQTTSGNVAVTLSGHHLIDKKQERNLYSWYTTMAQQLDKQGGRLYLDERVSQAMDISAYFSQTNALPVQWTLSDNMVSIAAYQSNLKTSVMAGQDRINIQLLSRGKSTNGQTVLAIPALLEEF